jgi:putative membrane protein
VLPALAGNAGDVAAAAGAVADAAAFVAGSAGRLQVATGPVAAGADRGHQAVQAAIAEADAQHPGQPHPALDAALAATATVAGLAHDADTVASADAARLSQLQQQARQVETTARRIQADAPGLATRARRALAQINRLNAGAHQVAAGAARLSAGASSAAGGARELAGGVARLHAGALQLQAGLGKLSAGADRLADGARRLDDGIARLAAGAHELADRLARGARRIPKYGPQQRDQRAGVMSDPVQLAKTALNPAVNYGTGFAPYFIPLSLWVGAMVGFTLLRALSDRALASNAAPWRVALIGFAPATFMGALQAVVLLLVLHFLIGLDMARPLAVMAFLVLTVMCFTAINQLLVARFGPGGRLLSIVLLLLQLTSAGGTYPVETSPPFFGAIHPFMPMSYVVRALRHLISGGDLAPVWQACAVLGAFVVASLVLTSMTARRRRVWTVQRLHPELAV